MNFHIALSKEAMDIGIVFATGTNFVGVSNLSKKTFNVTMSTTLALILGYQEVNVGEESVTIKVEKDFILTFSYNHNINMGRPRYLKVLCEQVEKSVMGDTQE